MLQLKATVNKHVSGTSSLNRCNTLQGNKDLKVQDIVNMHFNDELVESQCDR